MSFKKKRNESTEIKYEMKNRKLKAWTLVESPITKEDIDLITDPYSNWMADPQYFKQKGINIEWHNELE